MPNYLKEVDDWFVGYRTRIVREKAKKYFYVPNPSKSIFNPGAGIKNLQAASLKHPEVIIKLPKPKGSSKGLKGIRNHLDYISRNGQVELEDKDGNLFKGKKEVLSITKDWKKLNVAEESKHKEALNIVLSMPPGTNPEALKNAAREFAKQQFKNHEYVMAQHLDTAHPHVHLCVLMRNQYGRKMNPRKKNLFEWRILFAEKLRQEGIECSATRRQHRGVSVKSQNGILRHMQDSGRLPYRQMQAIEEIIDAVKNDKRPTHPFLKEVMQTQKIIIDEYGKISQELYKRGYKSEAKAISNLAKMVEKNTHETQSQKIFDQIRNSSRNHIKDININH